MQSSQEKDSGKIPLTAGKFVKAQKPPVCENEGSPTRPKPRVHANKHHQEKADDTTGGSIDIFVRRGAKKAYVNTSSFVPNVGHFSAFELR